MASTNPTQAEIQQMIQAAASQYGVSPSLALAVAKTESSFNPNSVNTKSGAIGIMQLMPATAAGLGVDPNDVQQNINGGVQYLSQLLNQYGGNVQQALWAYNAGPGNVAKGILPAETSTYIQNVQNNEANFSDVIPTDSGSTSSLSTAFDQTSANGSSFADLLTSDMSIAGFDVPGGVVIAGGLILLGLLATMFSRD